MRPIDQAMAASVKINVTDPKMSVCCIMRGPPGEAPGVGGYLEDEVAREGTGDKSLYCGFCGKEWVRQDKQIWDWLNNYSRLWSLVPWSLALG